MFGSSRVLLTSPIRIRLRARCLTELFPDFVEPYLRDLGVESPEGYRVRKIYGGDSKWCYLFWKLIASFRKTRKLRSKKKYCDIFFLVCAGALEEGHSTTLPKYNSYITVLRGIWFLRRVRNFSAVQLTFG